MKKGVLYAAGTAMGALLIGSFAPFASAATGFVTLSNFSGTPGTVVTASGDGWDGSDTVSLFFGSATGTPVVSTTTSPIGHFDVPLTIPTAPPGPLTIFAVNSTGGTAQNGFYVTPLAPTLSVTASAIVPYSTIYISGSGYAPNETVTLSLGSSSTTTVANASGSFSNAPLVIPSVPSGLYLIHGIGQSSTASAVYYFWINPFYPYAAPSAWYVTPGDPLSFSGTGYAPGEMIRVAVASTTYATITSDAKGAFKTPAFNIPLTLRNSVPLFTISGDTSRASTLIGVTIGDLYPYVTPSEWYLLPGSTVSFTGGGFGPGETVNVYQNADPTPASTFTVGMDGTFTDLGSTTVPFHHGPSIAYTLVGQQSDVSAQTGIAVGAFSPTIAPSAYYSAPGGTIGLTGAGFAPNESVTVQAASFATTTTADVSGNISLTSLPMPYLGGITLLITAKGAQSNVPTTVGVTLGQYYPLVTPSVFYTFPGDIVTFAGSDFAPNETVTVSGAASTTIPASASGTFTATTTIPMAAHGSATFIFTGNSSNSPVSTTLTVGARYFGLTASSYYVAPGASVTFHGTGFIAGEAVTIGGSVATTSATVAGDGAFTQAVQMPAHSGPATITFMSFSSGANLSLVITVAQLYPWAALNTYWAQGGTPLTISGGGFAANEQILFSANGSTFATTTADSTGAYSVSTFQPFAPPGPLTITAAGAQSGATASVGTTVAPVYTDFELGSYAGAPSSTVEFIGHGYLSNEPIAITTDRTGSTTVDTITADATGSFDDKSYSIPGNFTMGPLTFTATSLHSFDQKSITYFVTGN